jgi:hypothetical protein
MDAHTRHGDRQRRREALYSRFEQLMELPLLILAVAMIPLLIIPLVADLDPDTARIIWGIDWLIWAVFAFDYVIKLTLSTDRWSYVRREWASLLIVVLPFLRPLRIFRSARALRLLRLTRLVAIFGVIEGQGRRLLGRHKLHYGLFAGGVVLVVPRSSYMRWSVARAGRSTPSATRSGGRS